MRCQSFRSAIISVLLTEIDDLIPSLGDVFNVCIDASSINVQNKIQKKKNQKNPMIAKTQIVE